MINLTIVLMLSAPLEISNFGDDKVSRFGTELEISRFASSGSAVLFYAPLNVNGFTPGTWPVAGVTAPSVNWWGDDPTGSGGITDFTATAAGSDTNVNTPFCYDGTYDDLTSGCMKARRFNSATPDYYTTSITPVTQGDDLSLIMVWRATPNKAGSPAIVGSSSVGSAWLIRHENGAMRFYEDTSVGSSTLGACGPTNSNSGSWVVMAVAFDSASQVQYQCTEGSGTVATARTLPATPGTLEIGGWGGAAGNPMLGDIAYVGLAPNVLWTAAEMKIIVDTFVGLVDQRGSPPTFTNTGPNFCFVDGVIEQFDDNFPMLGCGMPPGMTGAGNPANAWGSFEMVTNSLAGSRDLATYWTDFGAPTVTATSTDLFADGRQTYRVTDDNSGALEYVYQTVDIDALDTGDKVQFCVEGKDSVGVALDLQVREKTGGSCVPADYDFAYASLTSSWLRFEGWTHTIGDGNCTELEVRMGPTDFASPASTGSAEFVAQMYKDQAWCLPLYVETEATAVAAGPDSLAYDVTGVLDTVAQGTIVEFDYTPYWTGPTSGSDWPFILRDSGTGTDFIYFQWQPVTNILGLQGNSALDGAVTLYGASSAWNPTVGTTYHFKIVINTLGASEVYIDDVQKAGATNPMTNPPDSLDALYISSYARQAGYTAEVVWRLP